MNYRRQDKGGLNRTMSVVSVLSLSLVLWAAPAGAALTNEVETWNGNTTEGWLRMDSLNGNPRDLTNSASTLGFSFQNQTMPTPNVSLVRADAGASAGRFVGNYIMTGVEHVQFKMLCPVAIPDQVRLYFGNSQNRHRWYYPVAVTKTGEWVTVGVPLEYDTGWRLDTAPTHGDFIEDLRSVAWIGIRIQRNSSVVLQPCSVDEFALACCATPGSGILPDVWVQRYFGGPGVLVAAGAVRAGDDNDNDGVRNYAEYLAGTDPTNALSILEMTLKPEEAPGATGLIVHWASVTNRSYVLWRSEDLTQGFALFDRNIPGTPPMNTYNDTTATNAGPYFYRISVDF